MGLHLELGVGAFFSQPSFPFSSLSGHWGGGNSPWSSWLAAPGMKFLLWEQTEVVPVRTQCSQPAGPGIDLSPPEWEMSRGKGTEMGPVSSAQNGASAYLSRGMRNNRILSFPG